MQVGNIIEQKGFVTKVKCVRGWTLSEVERALGFHQGRLSQGIYVALLAPGQSLPGPADFELRGYSQVADHRWAGTGTMNVTKLKEIAVAGWEPNGSDALVKVLPVIRHSADMDDDRQYPPGGGVPQWKLVRPLLFQIVAFVGNYPQGKWY
ncbi:hypothetical protein ACFSUS_10975 [Spirosoma soli]|uniref:DUF4304 domain-containing protein n=1 Tax=Spirosoma soli TaxID=1770529 RepID=A0ABW5M2A2_9BACT